MDNREKISVGSKIYLRSVIYRDNRVKHTDLVEYEVRKVGKKHFEIWRDKDENTCKLFNIETLTEATRVTQHWQVFLSDEDVLAENEYQELLENARTALNLNLVSIGTKLTLKQLREIDRILYYQD